MLYKSSSLNSKDIHTLILYSTFFLNVEFKCEVTEYAAFAAYVKIKVYKALNYKIVIKMLEI